MSIDIIGGGIEDEKSSPKNLFIMINYMLFIYLTEFKLMTKMLKISKNCTVKMY